jgi:hypothetical protein
VFWNLGHCPRRHSCGRKHLYKRTLPEASLVFCHSLLYLLELSSDTSGEPHHTIAGTNFMYSQHSGTSKSVDHGVRLPSFHSGCETRQYSARYSVSAACRVGREEACARKGVG